MHAVIRIEPEAGHAAVRCGVLILFANRFAELAYLDFTRQLREFARMAQPASMRIQRLQQGGREAARRSETCTGRNVGERRDLYLWGVETDQLQRFADDRVLHLADVVHVLELRVLEEDPLHERSHDRHVHVLVNRRGNQEAAVLAVIGRKISASAAERDSQRAARDDHRV